MGSSPRVLNIYRIRRPCVHLRAFDEVIKVLVALYLVYDCQNIAWNIDSIFKKAKCCSAVMLHQIDVWLGKHVKKLALLFILITLILSVRALGVDDYLTLKSIQENWSTLQGFMQENYLGTALTFILVYIVVIGLSIPGATVLTITSGFLFGAVVGTLFVNIAATIGALVAFFAARYFFGRTVQRKYKERLRKFNSELHVHGKYYLLTLRLIPIFPFFLINLLAGLTKIPVWTYIWTTSIGILPGSFVYAYAGQQIGVVTQTGDILTGRVLLAFALLGLFALAPVLWKRFHKHKKS